MDLLLYKLSPYLHHTMQSIVTKDSKNDCIVWDGSTVTWQTDIVMNQITPVAQEAPVMFGHVNSQIYMDICITHISYPTATILLGLADIKAYFRYPRIHADLTGAFDFIADSCIILPRQWYLAQQYHRQAGRPSGKPSRLSQKFLLTGPIWL